MTSLREMLTALVWRNPRLRAFRERCRKIWLADAAFTLIELMVVIAIIGILTAFLIPRVLAALQGSQVNAAVNEIKAIQTGIEEYYDQNNSFPAAGCTAVGNSCWQTLVTDLAPYISLPQNDGQLGNPPATLQSTSPSGTPPSITYTWTVPGGPSSHPNEYILTDTAPGSGSAASNGTYTIQVWVNGQQTTYVLNGSW